jgi:hypothetical protein
VRDNSHVRQSTARPAISSWDGARDPVMIAHWLRIGLQLWKDYGSYTSVFERLVRDLKAGTGDGATRST